MPRIQITPEILETQAKQLREKRDRHDQNYQAIKQHITSLQDEWQGEAQQAFYNRFNQSEPQMRQFAEELEKFAMLMDQVARTMRQAEEENKAAAQRLA